MRLHRLEIEGFGPFRSRQTIDFEAYAEDGIFLIAGRTGAGKSSILDAVCFGLYGGVPRYDGGEKRVRSDHSEPGDPSEVMVEFSTVAGRFRVTRSPEYLRPAKRGGGVTRQAATVLLERWTGDDWTAIAAKEREAGAELAGILQLSQQQFLQVILLAQNRFADFLLADSGERQKLLRRLFGTGRFEDVQKRLDEQRKAAGQALSAKQAVVDARLDEAERIADRITAQVEREDADPARDTDAGQVVVGAADARDAEEHPDPDGGAPTSAKASVRTVDDRIALLRAAEKTAAEQTAVRQERTRRRAEEHGLAEAALVTAKELRAAQAERDRARSALDALTAASAEIADDRRRLERARAAEPLRPLISAAERADAALTAARRAEDEAAVQWRACAAAAAAVESEDRLPMPLPVPKAAPEEEAASEAENTDQAEILSSLRAWLKARTKASGEWQQAAVWETQEGERAEELATAEETLATAHAQLVSLEQRQAGYPEQLAALTERRDSERRIADRAEGLASAVAEAESRSIAAAETERLAEELRAAERALLASSEEHSVAQTTLTRLRQRRLEGIAGELASSLEPGQPCVVCGAKEHPHPAEHADPISAEDLAAAEESRDAAAQAERRASERLNGVRTRHAATAERAGGRTLAQAGEERAAAIDAHRAALAAQGRHRELAQELAELVAESEGVEAEKNRAREHIAATEERLVAIRHRHAETERAIEHARGGYRRVADRLAAAEEQIAAASALATAIEERRTRAEIAATSARERDVALAGSRFAATGEAAAALLSDAERDALTARVEEHAVQVEKERAILAGLDEQDLPAETIDLAPLRQRAEAARASWQDAVFAAAEAESIQDGLTGVLRAAAEEHARIAAESTRFETLRALADTLSGRGANTYRMNLETFVLAAELEEIVTAANLRLRDMSDGRYQLRHSDARAAHGAASGLGIVVLDAFTGQTRPARSLSGGETFLASLALALGLAEVVTARAGGIRLDTLFIDEGFGSLDAATLEVAMRTLDELRQGGRTVGVISHVEAMQEQIPAQLTVRSLPEGPSVIDTTR